MRYWLLPLLALTLSAQTPAFEVASIRPSTITGPGGRNICGVANAHSDAVVTGTESMLVAGDRPLFVLIYEAYEGSVDAFDLPGWVTDSGHFAVNVKIPPNTQVGTCRAMLRNLLAERFHLITAVEPHEVGRFFLKVAKSGSKLKPVAAPSDPNGSQRSELKDGNVTYFYRAAPMTRILDVLSIQASNDARARGFDPTFLNGKVIDETGLTGFYDCIYTLPIKPDLNDSLAESMGDAIARQLGLTLEFRRIPGKVLVIRSGDRTPTEN